MSYDLFMQGPGVYIPVLLISIAITMLAYGAFPLIFSRTRKKQITKKKFTLLCYGVNLLVMIAFIAFGSNSSGAPYMLWTWIFSSAGIRKLDERGVFNVKQKESLPENVEEKFVEVSNEENNELSGVEQEVSLSKNKRNLTIDIINLLVLVFVLILSTIGTEGEFWYNNEECAVILFFWIGYVVLQIINIVKPKNNIVISVIMSCSLLLMMGMYMEISGTFDDGAITLIMFCLLYLLVFELCQLFIKIILEKYYTTQSYKVKCYKKIEKLNTYRERGIITEEEYEKARKQIVSKIRY